MDWKNDADDPYNNQHQQHYYQYDEEDIPPPPPPPEEDAYRENPPPPPRLPPPPPRQLNVSYRPEPGESVHSRSSMNTIYTEQQPQRALNVTYQPEPPTPIHRHSPQVHRHSPQVHRQSPQMVEPLPPAPLARSVSTGRVVTSRHEALYCSMEELPTGFEPLENVPRASKNWLLAGQILTKHCKKAKPRKRHVFVDDSLSHLTWKSLATGKNATSSSIKTIDMREVSAGRTTEPLLRSSWGKFVAKEELCFSIRTKDRTVDLEAATERDRDRWVSALKDLLRYVQTLRVKNRDSQGMLI